MYGCGCCSHFNEPVLLIAGKWVYDAYLLFGQIPGPSSESALIVKAFRSIVIKEESYYERMLNVIMKLLKVAGGILDTLLSCKQLSLACRLVQSATDFVLLDDRGLCI